MARGEGGGRPPRVLTEAEIDQIEGLASVLSQDQMADYFGITRPTFKAIMDRQPEVSLRYQKGRAAAIGAIANGLIQEARDGNMTAAIFYLKTQGGWKETSNVELSGKDGDPIKTEEVGDGTRKLTAFLEALAVRSGTPGPSDAG